MFNGPQGPRERKLFEKTLKISVNIPQKPRQINLKIIYQIGFIRTDIEFICSQIFNLSIEAFIISKILKPAISSVYLINTTQNLKHTFSVKLTKANLVIAIIIFN